VVALPHDEAVAAVRKIIPLDHHAELSIPRLPQPKAREGLRRGEGRKIEPMTQPKRPSDLNQMALSIIDTDKGERPGLQRRWESRRQGKTASKRL